MSLERTHTFRKARLFLLWGPVQDGSALIRKQPFTHNLRPLLHHWVSPAAWELRDSCSRKEASRSVPVTQTCGVFSNKVTQEQKLVCSLWSSLARDSEVDTHTWLETCGLQKSHSHGEGTFVQTCPLLLSCPQPTPALSLFFSFFFKIYLFIKHTMYCWQGGHQISLQMGVSHQVGAGN